MARTDIPELDAVRGAVDALRERMSLAAYATDISEWDWMEAQYRESRYGAPPTLEDARRALVFVVSWIHRYEAAEARYPAERWAQWRDDQRAPVTGLPGAGPRVLHVTLDRRTWGDSRRAWTAQLADVPEPEDEYASALSTANHERDDTNLRFGGLGRAGELAGTSDESVGPEQIVEAIADLLERTRAVRERWRDARGDRERTAAELRAPFAAVFATELPGNADFGEVDTYHRTEPFGPGGQGVDQWQITVELRNDAQEFDHLATALNQAQTNADGIIGVGPRVSTSGSTIWIPATKSPSEARSLVLEAITKATVMQRAATARRARALTQLERLEKDVNRLLHGQGLGSATGRDVSTTQP